MHPEIAKLVSYLRYGGKLRNGFKEKSQIDSLKGVFSNGIIMITHNAKEQSDEEGNYINIHEIKMMKLYIDLFPAEKLKQIGIVTIYKSQV